MDFLVVMINVFGLVAFIVIWLSISFITFDIYKTGKNLKSAVSLAKLSYILRNILIVWFLLLLISFLVKSDTPVATILFLTLFLGFIFFIYRLYGNILNAVTSISKDDGSEQSHELIRNSTAKIERHKQSLRAKKDFNNFRAFFWSLNGLITVGALMNSWIRDSEDISILYNVVSSLFFILLLQLMFLPIYLIAKKIIFATLNVK